MFFYLMWSDLTFVCHVTTQVYGKEAIKCITDTSHVVRLMVFGGENCVLW